MMKLPSWIECMFYHNFTSTVYYHFNVCGKGPQSFGKVYTIGVAVGRLGVLTLLPGPCLMLVLHLLVVLQYGQRGR